MRWVSVYKEKNIASSAAKKIQNTIIHSESLHESLPKGFIWISSSCTLTSSNVHCWQSYQARQLNLDPQPWWIQLHLYDWMCAWQFILLILLQTLPVLSTCANCHFLLNPVQLKWSGLCLLCYEILIEISNGSHCMTKRPSNLAKWVMNAVGAACWGRQPSCCDTQVRYVRKHLNTGWHWW